MHPTPDRGTRRSTLLTRWTAALFGLALIAGCGGGGGGMSDDVVGGGGSELPTAYAQGPISGFGSIIVNGVRYDDSGAKVSDDDGGVRGRGELKLGMMVEIDATAMDRMHGMGRAMHVRFGSEMVGPVAAIDRAAGTFRMLDQTVAVKPTTVFDDDLSGLDAITVGAVLEVHAMFDAATDTYIATRIESEAGATAYRLRGLVSALDTTAKTFNIGDALIDYAGVAAADLPAAFANGQRVRVRLQTTQVAGKWVAITIRTGVRKVDDRDDAHLRGTITRFASLADFAVNGLPVDASRAAFPDGSGGVVLGATVEVQGIVRAGVLVASKVELDDRHAGDRHRMELHGAISGLDTVARTFRLRGVTVSYAGTVDFQRGSASDLKDGAQVEVKGRPGADPRVLQATQIEFER